MKHPLFMTAAAGLLCMSLAACSKPAEKAPASASAAPATTAPAAAPAPAPTAVAAAPAAANATTDTVVTKFKANGFSPAWEAMIDGNTVTFEVPEIMTPDGKKHTIKVERSAYAKGATFNGKDGNTPFSLDIKGAECIKTGDKREFTATLAYGKSVYKGCADAVK